MSLRDQFPCDADRCLVNVIERRLAREPFAYISGGKEFFGRKFKVDRRVLVPRPETEILVSSVLGFVSNGRCEPLRIADVGTGSGILAITLALEFPESEIIATDSSSDALNVASENARKFGVSDRISLRCGDLARPLQGQFQIVVANLPYVRSSAYKNADPELMFEPPDALKGGIDGMRYIGRFIDQLPLILAEGPSAAMLEIDPPLVSAVKDRVHRAVPTASLKIVKDLANLARCAEIRTAEVTN